MTRLPLKDGGKITMGQGLINYHPKPGTMMIFPGYLPHQFTVDSALEPFRFVHFNIKAVETAI